MWNYNTPGDDREVLTCGHAGQIVAYWAEGAWWESWCGQKMDRDNVRPWAWQDLTANAPRARMGVVRARHAVPLRGDNNVRMETIV